MTSRWLISFSLATAGLWGATLTGKVELSGSQDPSVRKDRNYAGVVVWLERVGAVSRPAPIKTEMIQKNKTFLPHVLAIPVGSTVSFPNYDPIFHNAFSNYSGQVFDVGLYPPGTTRNVAFRKAGIVRVFCNIHPAMSALIVVLDSSYYAVTNRAGAFTLRDVPPGQYSLHVFHERATDDVLKALSRRISVSEDETLPPPGVSETGYVMTPHSNKFGKEYPPTEDMLGYPAPKR